MSRLVTRKASFPLSSEAEQRGVGFVAGRRRAHGGQAAGLPWARLLALSSSRHPLLCGGSSPSGPHVDVDTGWGHSGGDVAWETVFAVGFCAVCWVSESVWKTVFGFQ